MTEDEAKTKACPQTLAALADNGGAIYASAPCVASACMAWRVNPDPSKSWHDEERAIYRERNGLPKSGGYCGLAGRPE